MGLGEAGAHMQKMAIYHFQIPTLPQFATFLHGKNACEETAGYLASIASCHQL